MSDSPKATNLTWQTGLVGREARERVAGHGGVVLWLTGLSGSGKSTIARGVEQRLFERGVRTFVLDAENVRYGLNSDLGFSPADRSEHIRRLGHVAALFAEAATVTLVPNIAPYRDARHKLRETIGADFHEMWIATSLSVCEERDTRGLYKKARAGEITGFTGIDAPYEEPQDAELVVNTEGETVAQSVQQVLAYLEGKAIIPAVS